MANKPKPPFAVLLVNLGTPESPTPSAVRRFLSEFLWDPRVVDLWRSLWWFILNGFILRFRPKPVSKLYQRIWMPDGSPIRVYSEALATALQSKLSERYGQTIPVELGMTYGKRHIRETLLALRKTACRRVVVLPLFPQYSVSTTAPVFDAVARALAPCFYLPEIRQINEYYQHPAYINAVVHSIKQHWAEKGRGEHLVFSFHGIPEKYREKGDPYPEQCHVTAKAVVQILALKDSEWTLAFQSRFGPAPWVKPYTDETLKALAEKGIAQVDVICPGFAVDCLETLEEIAIQAKALFCEAGGKTLNYIPALNHSTLHVDALSQIVSDAVGGLAMSG